MYSRLLSVCLLVTTVQSQGIDPDVLTNIFGRPPSAEDGSVPSQSTTQRLEDITVQPTDSNSVFTDKGGDECKCVPYYLCDNELNAVHTQNETVTGWGQLDIRFGEDRECQESVERCCKNPISPPTPTEPTINPVEPVKGCGLRNPKGLDFEVLGGSGAEAGFGEYPWVVAILDTFNNSYFGVGVLIHPSVVMTGAHIAEKLRPGSLKIRAGEWDTQTMKERLPHSERLAEEIIIHEDYRPKTLWNDIALLRLDAPVNLDKHINVICLPEQNENFDQSRDCVANGWGKNVFGKPGRYAVILKRVEVNMVPHSQCNNLLKRTRLGGRFHLDRSFVCAGGEEGKDTCQGDGGAPLACPIGDNRYKLTGLVAWGIGCGQRNVPAVYVNVAAFRTWIDDKMARWNFDTSGSRA